MRTGIFSGAAVSYLALTRVASGVSLTKLRRTPSTPHSAGIVPGSYCAANCIHGIRQHAMPEVHPMSLRLSIEAPVQQTSHHLTVFVCALPVDLRPLNAAASGMPSAQVSAVTALTAGQMTPTVLGKHLSDGQFQQPMSQHG